MLSATEIVFGVLTSMLGLTHAHVSEAIVEALTDAGHISTHN